MFCAPSVAIARIVSDWLPPKVEANSSEGALIATRWDSRGTAIRSRTGAVRLKMLP
jgi:hypothetical protein